MRAAAHAFSWNAGHHHFVPIVKVISSAVVGDSDAFWELE